MFTNLSAIFCCLPSRVLAWVKVDITIATNVKNVNKMFYLEVN